MVSWASEGLCQLVSWAARGNPQGWHRGPGWDQEVLIPQPLSHRFPRRRVRIQVDMSRFKAIEKIKESIQTITSPRQRDKGLKVQKPDGSLGVKCAVTTGNACVLSRVRHRCEDLPRCGQRCEV